jgi:hypothetical protein
MYTTCIHCTRDLGRNEALEEFQVGRRLAFDPRLGRLWVVCRHCERWNLSPLEERWEAIEAAERRFRDARLRVSTDNVGLARLREGLDLVRIGEPMRPEMAAWRYGDQFGRRRNRQLLMTGGVVGVASLAVGSLVWAGAALSFSGVMFQGGLWDRLIHGNPKQVVARIATPEGGSWVVERAHARMSIIERSENAGELTLSLPHRHGRVRLSGDEAMRAAAKVLPVVNRFGGSRKLVQSSVDILEEMGSAADAIRYIQQSRGAQLSRPPLSARNVKHPKLVKTAGALHALPARERLALEMALHEESERRAMDGELHELERAWREAEEIAKISDDMFTSVGIEERLRRLRSGQS